MKNKREENKFCFGNKKVENKFCFGNKKGQFYLVAAILIIMILVGVASVKTYAVIKTEPRKIKDISSELKEETTRIIDYGIFNSNVNPTIEDFIDDKFAPYFLKKTENTAIVFIYGDSSGLKGVKYLEANTGQIDVTIGHVLSGWDSLGIYTEKITINPDANPLNVEIFERDFKFEIIDNQMFYFIIAQEKDGEIYIERN